MTYRLLLLIGLFSSYAYAESPRTRFEFGMSNGFLSRSSPALSSGYGGGLNVGVSYFLNPHLSVGVGYEMVYDFSKSRFALSGFDLPLKWYFWGEGVPVVSGTPEITSATKRRYAFYVGPCVVQRNYILGTSDSPSSGNSVSLNIAVGAEMALSQKFSLVAQFTYGFVTLLASEDRFKIRQTGFILGGSYSF
ncbi:porin family protein [bacterium]|nr:porin family protein [bacterium]